MNPEVFACPTNQDFDAMDANGDGNLTVEEYFVYANVPQP